MLYCSASGDLLSEVGPYENAVKSVDSVFDVSHLVRIFENADQNQDGVLDIEEVGELLEYLGMDIDVEDFMRIFTSFGSNAFPSNGLKPISLNAFLRVLSPIYLRDASLGPKELFMLAQNPVNYNDQDVIVEEDTDKIFVFFVCLMFLPLHPWFLFELLKDWYYHRGVPNILADTPMVYGIPAQKVHAVHGIQELMQKVREFIEYGAIWKFQATGSYPEEDGNYRGERYVHKMSGPLRYLDNTPSFIPHTKCHTLKLIINLKTEFKKSTYDRGNEPGDIENGLRKWADTVGQHDDNQRLDWSFKICADPERKDDTRIVFDEFDGLHYIVCAMDDKPIELEWWVGNGYRFLAILCGFYHFYDCLLNDKYKSHFVTQKLSVSKQVSKWPTTWPVDPQMKHCRDSKFALAK